jgi:SAM-dependent methyltransferase
VDTTSFNFINAQKCLQAFSGHPKRILIAGCGQWEDAKCFNYLLDSPAEIIGVDIGPGTANHYNKPENAIYIKCDIANLPIESQSFDIAYTFATFEHVHNIRDGWQNMVNTLRPGGMLYSVSSPLWMSPYGHHKPDLFRGFPWIHLYHPNPEQLVSFCLDQKITSNDGIEMHHHINYMLAKEFFNKHPSSFYSKCASSLTGLASLTSYFDYLPSDYLEGHSQLLEMGCSAEDLLAITHNLAGFK